MTLEAGGIFQADDFADVLWRRVSDGVHLMIMVVPADCTFSALLSDQVMYAEVYGDYEVLIKKHDSEEWIPVMLIEANERKITRYYP